jgi:hypothetical protein
VTIDWSTIIASIVGAVVLVGLTYLANIGVGPKLITWFVNSAAVEFGSESASPPHSAGQLQPPAIVSKIPLPTGQPATPTQTTIPARRMWIHTHTFVIRNVGLRPAHNVVVGHYSLPDFSVYPSVSRTVNPLPGGGAEIVFPIVVPREQLAITYLYFPPLLWNQIHAYVKCDEGMGRNIPVALQRVYPVWVLRITFALLVLGIATILFLIFQGSLWLGRLIAHR